MRAWCYLGGILVVLALSASRVFAQSFHEDFNGTALDPDVWAAELGDGQIVVENGFVSLSCSGATFPVVTSRFDPFPPGDFRLTVGMQYLSQRGCGDGLGAMDNFWENYQSGSACRPFLLWQDDVGLYVYAGSSGSTGLASSPETGYHVYEWLYLGGYYQFSMDGVVQTAGGCAPRATRLFFGHPHPIGCFGGWTSFAIDFIDISSAGPTTTRKQSIGSVKVRYR